MSRDLMATALAVSALALADVPPELGTVKDATLPVYREMSAHSAVIATLKAGDKVRIDWSVTVAEGAWCSVSRTEQPQASGFVLCDRLERQMTGGGPAPVAPKAQAIKSGAPTLSQAWGLAASALLTERNRKRHDTLAGVQVTEEFARKERRLLERWWDAPDRAGLLQALAWIDAGGHRHRFAALGEKVADLSPERFEALLASPGRGSQEVQSLSIARKHFRQLGSKGLVGWDYARYVSLCRWGYAVGYLSEDEAWEGIMHAAGILRKTFRSWQELGENYLIGRQFWSLEETSRNGAAYEAAFQKLLSDPASPWNRIPWDLDLP